VPLFKEGGKIPYKLIAEFEQCCLESAIAPGKTYYWPLMTKEVKSMNTSKLEVCVAVLQVLNKEGQLSAKEIASKTKINPRTLEESISILAEQDVLKKQDDSGLPVYGITEGGIKVLEYFNLEEIIKCRRI